MPDRRRLRVAVLAVAVAAVLSACAGIPTSGPVHEAGQLGGSGDEPFTRIIPPGPAENAQPEAIIGGFLTASASFDDDHAIARQFLTPAAARSWEPGAKVRVYRSDTTAGGGTATTCPADTCQFSAPQAGTMTAQGAYTADPPGTVLRTAFSMARVGGQWRIAKLDAGLLLTTNDLTRAYRSYDIYFPDPGRTVLVPDQIMVPVGPGVSTSLVQALLVGPTPWLSKAVRTAVPSGTRLVVDSVPVKDGVAQVDLTGQPANISRAEAQAMSAQIVWTLRQLGGVTAVRITTDGVPLRLPGFADTQSTTSWGSFDPDGGLSGAQAYAVSQGRAVVLDGTDLKPVRGPLGNGSTTVSQVVPSFDGTALAGLSEDGRHLLLSGLTASASGAVPVKGTRLTTPTWDRSGDVFVVDTAGTATAAWEVPQGSTSPRKVALDLAGVSEGGTVRAMRLSRDGVRAALLVDDTRGVGQVYLGVVVRSSDGVTITGFHVLSTELATVQDVAWASADRLVVLARQSKTTDPTQAWLLDLNGGVEQAYGAVPDASPMTAVAAAPDLPMLASTAGGTLWRYTNGLGWGTRSLAAAAFPSYPG